MPEASFQDDAASSESDDHQWDEGTTDSPVRGRAGLSTGIKIK